MNIYNNQIDKEQYEFEMNCSHGESQFNNHMIEVHPEKKYTVLIQYIGCRRSADDSHTKI